MYGLVRELRASRAGSAEFDRLLARLIEEATGHFGLEEARVFPTVREQATPVRLVALGEQARDTERTPSPLPPTTGPRTTLPPDDLVAPELPWHERMHRLFRFGDTREN